MSRQGTRLTETYGANLKAAMEDQQVTVDELARDLEVAARLVQKWRAGDSLPRTDNMARIALRLGKPVSWFFAENGVAA